MKQSRLDNSRDALMIELTTIDLLIIDDFALEPMSRDESRDVYQLLVERNARASTIVTSNRDTAEWLAVFDDTMLAQSAVDRFKNNAYDLVIEGESYRSRLKPSVDKDGLRLRLRWSSAFRPSASVGRSAERPSHPSTAAIRRGHQFGAVFESNHLAP